MFSLSRKILTCRRSSPCSFTTRSRKPTCNFHNSSSASATVRGVDSREIWLRPPANSVRKPVMLNVTIPEQPTRHRPETSKLSRESSSRQHALRHRPRVHDDRQASCLHHRVGLSQTFCLVKSIDLEHKDAAKLTVIAKWSSNNKLLHFR